MSFQTSRRDFIKSAALAGAGLLTVEEMAWAQAVKGPNEQLNFACIGIDGKGSSDTADAARFGNIVAICDIDEDRLAKAGTKYASAKKYTDFRKMLEEVGGSIDAVTVSTADHTHAVAAAMAMRMGKHCFCQKPLTRTLFEARTLGEIAREKKLATQMGNQGTASNSLRKAAAYIRAGNLGKVREVHCWTDRPIWPQGGARPAAEPVPAKVQWDLWLGPAPFREYAKGYHPFAWRGFWDFGTGALGDMACHTVNMPYMALDLKFPTSVQAQTSGHNRDSYPQWSIIKFEFPELDGRAPLSMTWYDGGKLPSPDLIGGEQPKKSGIIVAGDKGTMYAAGDYAENGYKLLGGAVDAEVEFEKSPGHFEEWIRAIRGGPAARSNFPDYAGPLTETILLGNLAVWSDGKKIEWDAKNLRATNAPEVAKIIRSDYRPGYIL